MKGERPGLLDLGGTDGRGDFDRRGDLVRRGDLDLLGDLVWRRLRELLIRSQSLAICPLLPHS